MFGKYITKLESVIFIKRLRICGNQVCGQCAHKFPGRSVSSFNRRNCQDSDTVPNAYSHVHLNGELLYGVHPIQMALKAKRRVFHQAWYKITNNENPAVKRLMEAGVPCMPLYKKDFNTLCGNRDTYLHQGVCADVSKLNFQDFDCGIPFAEQSLWVVVDNIMNPMKLGVFLRTCSAYGVKHFIFSTKNSHLLGPRVSKSSSGYLEMIEIFLTADMPSVLRTLRETGCDVLGTSAAVNPGKTFTFYDVKNYKRQGLVFIVFGNEESEIRQSIAEQCSAMLTIETKEMGNKLPWLEIEDAASIFLKELCYTREPSEK